MTSKQDKGKKVGCLPLFGKGEPPPGQNMKPVSNHPPCPPSSKPVPNPIPKTYIVGSASKKPNQK